MVFHSKLKMVEMSCVDNLPTNLCGNCQCRPLLKTGLILISPLLNGEIFDETFIFDELSFIDDLIMSTFCRYINLIYYNYFNRPIKSTHLTGFFRNKYYFTNNITKHNIFI